MKSNQSAKAAGRRRLAETRILQLNRLLRTISAVNQLMVREADRDRLLHESCRILVENAQFRMAWVGFMDPASGLVKPAATAGVDQGYTETLQVRWDNSPEGQGPTGTAIRTGQHVVFDDVEHHPGYELWRTTALAKGYRSSAAFPLRVRDHVVGVLSVYADTVGTIGAEEIALLDELAMDLGYALQTIEDRATRERAEAALAESEERLRMVVETAPDAIFIQTGGRFAYVNAATLRLFGASSPAALLGLPVPERFHPDFREQVRERIRQLNEERQSVSMVEEACLKLDGTRVEVEISAVPITYQGQMGALVFARDITERLRGVKKQQEVERSFRAVVEAIPDLLWLKDPDGVYRACNRRFERFFGAAEDKIVGRTDYEFVPREQADFFRDHDRKAMAAAGPTVNEEWVTFASDGHREWLETIKTPMYDPQGQLVGVLGVGRDITGRKQAEEALRNSEAQFRELFSNMTSGVAIYEARDEGADFVFKKINEAGLRFGGLKRDDVIGKTVTEVFPGIRQMGLLEVFRRVWKTGVAEHYPATQYTDNRLSKWYENSVFKIPSGEVVVVYDDITERKQAEEALSKARKEIEESERLKTETIGKLNEAQEVAKIGSWDWNLATNAVWWSDEVYRLFGLSPQEYTPNFEMNERFIHPDDQERYRTAFDRSLETGETLAFEARILAGDGSVKYCSVLGRCSFDAAGKPTRFVGTIMDITERRRAEEAWRENELRYRTLADSGQALIWTAGLDKKCDYFNQPWLQFTGRTLEQELGDGWVEGVHPEDLDRCVQTYVAAFDRHQSFSMEYRLRHTGGEYRWIQDNGMPRFNREGQFLGYIGHCLDITGHKQAEAEREKLQAQLNQVQKMESIGRLAGGVAHDFNNMLAAILGHAELALEKLDPEQPIFDDLREIQKAAERSADLTRQLLAFARKQTVAPRVMDLNTTVDGMLKMLRRLIGEGIELVWQPGAELGPIKMDPSQLDQILANLAVNARDAIGGVGTFSIATQNATIDEAGCAGHADAVAGEYVELVVSDTGCGMSKEVLGHLFEPFFTTKGIGEGTGLGLATVYGIIRQNHGFVTVDSEPGCGTTFKIYLARYQDQDGTVQAKAAAAPVPRGRETVLLVEDEPVILNITTTMLERLDYTVLAAATPGEAIRLARERHGEIHLLMTDVVMPEMNGRDLAKNLLSLYPNLKRLFMSGYTADVIAHHGVLDEGVNFIQKPFSKSDLAAKLREVLDGR